MGFSVWVYATGFKGAELRETGERSRVRCSSLTGPGLRLLMATLEQVTCARGR